MFTKQLVVPAIASLFMVFSAGCKKDVTPDLSAQVSAESSTKTLSRINSQPLAVVNLGVAGNFTILSKSGITDVYKSAVTGDIGTSPITGAAIGLTCGSIRYYINS